MNLQHQQGAKSDQSTPETWQSRLTAAPVTDHFELGKRIEEEPICFCFWGSPSSWMSYGFHRCWVFKLIENLIVGTERLDSLSTEWILVYYLRGKNRFHPFHAQYYFLARILPCECSAEPVSRVEVFNGPGLILSPYLARFKKGLIWAGPKTGYAIIKMKRVIKWLNKGQKRAFVNSIINI